MLGVVGLVLVVLSIPSVKDNAVLGAIGIAGGLLIVASALIAVFRRRQRITK